MRINRFLARCGIGSRRECDTLIENRTVRVNNVILEDFSYEIKKNDVVAVNSKIVNPQPLIIYKLNKPKGFISSVKDDKGRKCITDIIKSNKRLFPVGRLDYNTTGIILITNDGEITNKLLHPRNMKKRIYIVETRNDIASKRYRQLKIGIKISSNHIAKGEIVKLNDKFTWKVILSEGKKHEIKKIFFKLGAPVSKLHRIEFAGIKLNKLRLGEYRQLTEKEFKILFD